MNIFKKAVLCIPFVKKSISESFEKGKVKTLEDKNSLEKIIGALEREKRTLEVATKTQAEAIQSKDAKTEEFRLALAEKDAEILTYRPIMNSQHLILDYCMKNKVKGKLGNESLGRAVVDHLESQDKTIKDQGKEIELLRQEKLITDKPILFIRKSDKPSEKEIEFFDKQLPSLIVYTTANIKRVNKLINECSPNQTKPNKTKNK